MSVTLLLRTFLTRSTLPTWVHQTVVSSKVAMPGNSVLGTVDKGQLLCHQQQAAASIKLPNAPVQRPIPHKQTQHWRCLHP